MGVFLVWLVLSILVGIYAESKGHSGVGWFLLSLALSPLICFIIELIRSPNVRETERRAIQSGEMKKCPACAELIRVEATKCRYCGEALSAHTAPSSSVATSDAVPGRRFCSNCSSYTEGYMCGVCGEALGIPPRADTTKGWMG